MYRNNYLCVHCGRTSSEKQFVTYTCGNFGLRYGVCRNKACIDKMYVSRILKVEDYLNDRSKSSCC